MGWIKNCRKSVGENANGFIITQNHENKKLETLVKLLSPNFFEKVITNVSNHFILMIYVYASYQEALLVLSLSFLLS